MFHWLFLYACMSYYVYVLRSSKRSSLYIGQTQDVQARLERHNKGYNKATKTGIPWIMLGYIETESRQEALQLERKLKSWRDSWAVINLSVSPALPTR